MEFEVRLNLTWTAKGSGGGGIVIKKKLGQYGILTEIFDDEILPGLQIS